MGYGLDEAIECDDFDQTCFDYWRDKHGNDHQVTKMETRHIKNILRCINLRIFNDQWLRESGEQWRDVLNSELESRGIKL